MSQLLRFGICVEIFLYISVDYDIRFTMGIFLDLIYFVIKKLNEKTNANLGGQRFSFFYFEN